MSPRRPSSRCWVGERGETLWDEGEQTPEERDLGFRFFDERSPEASQEGYWERKDLSFPNEDCVTRLAGAWSLDPTTLDERFPVPGLGLLGNLPQQDARSTSASPVIGATLLAQAVWG